VVEIVPNKGAFGKQFRQNSKAVLEQLSNLSKEDSLKVEAALKEAG